MSTSTRRPFFCGNWKLNGSIAESLALATDVRNGVSTVRAADVVVAPSFTALHAVAKRLEDGPVAVAAQDCFWEDKGAFTGEVSATQLADAGCKYVILGHSERRQLFGEPASVNLRRAGRGLPIICVGERAGRARRGRDPGPRAGSWTPRSWRVGDADPRAASSPTSPCGRWHGRNATPEQAQEVHAFNPRAFAGDAARLSRRACAFYGGSMKSGGVRALWQPDVDGAGVAHRFLPNLRCLVRGCSHGDLLTVVHVVVCVFLILSSCCGHGRGRGIASEAAAASRSRIAGAGAPDEAHVGDGLHLPSGDVPGAAALLEPAGPARLQSLAARKAGEKIADARPPGGRRT
jgi:triosephosphate isomerase